jgi:hypothetical protein
MVLHVCHTRLRLPRPLEHLVHIRHTSVTYLLHVDDANELASLVLMTMMMIILTAYYYDHYYQDIASRTFRSLS